MIKILFIAFDKLIFDWYGRLYLFDKLMKWTKDNLKETYIPYLNKDYDAQKEERNVPYVNLIEVNNKGEDITALAN